MNVLISVAFLVLLSCQTGYSVVCRSCDYGECKTTTNITCELLQMCVTQTAINGNMMKKGCSNPIDCTRDTTSTENGQMVTFSNDCCTGDFCNSATTQRASFVIGIAALIALCVAKLF